MPRETDREREHFPQGPLLFSLLYIHGLRIFGSHREQHGGIFVGETQKDKSVGIGITGRETRRLVLKDGGMMIELA